MSNQSQKAPLDESLARGGATVYTPAVRVLVTLLRRAQPSLRGSLASRVLAAILLSALSGATAGVLPALVGVAINAITGKAMPKGAGLAGVLTAFLQGAPAWKVMVTALVGTLVTVAVSVLSSHRGTALGAELTAALRIELLRTVLHASPREVDAAGQRLSKNKGGPPPPPGVKMPEIKGAEVVKLAVAREAAQVADFVSAVITGLPQALFTLIVVATELVMGGLSMVLLGTAVLFISSRFFADRASKVVGTKMAAMQQSDVVIFGQLGETLAAIEDLRLLGARKQALRELAESAHRAADARLAFAGAIAMSGQIKSVFAALSPLLVLVVLSVTGLAAEAGDVAKLLLFVPLLMARFEALDALRTGFIERGSVLRAIVDLLTLPEFPTPHPSPAKQGDVAGGTITFNDVKYVPPGSTNKVLDGVNLTIPKGAVVGICGRSGCGKSTLVRLLLRLDEPTGGSIAVDDKDLTRFGPDTLASTFAVLGQASKVFERTIGENLRMGVDDGPPDGRLREILKLVKLDQLAEEGEGKGLATRFKAMPPSLSGGEQRRVLLARMLARDAKVFVLDEPEAGMPSATAEELLKAVSELAAGRTCVVVTHAPHLLKSTFNVVIDGGKVVAQGTHEELVEKSEAYRALLAEGIQRAAKGPMAGPMNAPPNAGPPRPPPT
ncbi:MAG: ABC transporter ATP-binding protein [Polyangiaceae bacterium]|nr:ABC transporter ATP-binding protein [Polyangiaceae bacterium]